MQELKTVERVKKCTIIIIVVVVTVVHRHRLVRYVCSEGARGHKELHIPLHNTIHQLEPAHWHLILVEHFGKQSNLI